MQRTLATARSISGSCPSRQTIVDPPVGFVQLACLDWLPATGSPFADQGGFTKASMGRDEGKFMVQTLVQPFNQTGAVYNFGPWRGVGVG